MSTTEVSLQPSPIHRSRTAANAHIIEQSSLNSFRNSKEVWGIAMKVYAIAYLIASTIPVISTIIFLPRGIILSYRARKSEGIMQKKLQAAARACFFVSIPIVGNLRSLKALVTVLRSRHA